MNRIDLVDRCKAIIKEAYEEATEMIVAYLELNPAEQLQSLCKEIDPDNWNALRNKVQRAQGDRKSTSGADSARARDVRSAKRVLREASPDQLAELLAEPEIRQNVHRAQDIVHAETERRSKQNQREAIGEQVSDELDEQQRLIDAEAKAFAARRELRDMLYLLDKADLAAARDSWREDFLKTLDDLAGRVEMARGLVEGRDLDDELAQLLAREES